jgi:hypothetical protein
MNCQSRAYRLCLERYILSSPHFDYIFGEMKQNGTSEMRHLRVRRITTQRDTKTVFFKYQTQQECSSVPDAGPSRTVLDICDQPDRDWQIEMSRNCKSANRGFDGVRQCSISSMLRQNNLELLQGPTSPEMQRIT